MIGGYNIIQMQDGREARIGTQPDLKQLTTGRRNAEVGTDRIPTEAERISGCDVIPLAFSGGVGKTDICQVRNLAKCCVDRAQRG